MSFTVIVDPSSSDLARVEANDPANPFSTVAYTAAQRALGDIPVLFAGPDCDNQPSGAVGYMQGRAFSRMLLFPSAPALSDSVGLWNAALDFCRRYHVAEAQIGSFAAKRTSLPSWSAPASLRDRTEWVLQLKDSTRHVATNHRRNINKARREGVTVESTDDDAAAEQHVRLMAASMQRRDKRGESVPFITPQETRRERGLLVAGAARIYRASHGGTVVSSLLVLNSRDGAYYQSAGTSPEGMEIGASTFLISEVIRALTEEGKSIFNLGGAGPESEGLMRFKAGFGAEPVSLAAGVYQVASPMHRKLRAAIRRIREPSEART